MCHKNLLPWALECVACHAHEELQFQRVDANISGTLTAVSPSVFVRYNFGFDVQQCLNKNAPDSALLLRKKRGNCPKRRGHSLYTIKAINWRRCTEAAATITFLALIFLLYMYTLPFVVHAFIVKGALRWILRTPFYGANSIYAP
ncbi:unnamed protein product [Ixodes persulcatus]